MLVKLIFSMLGLNVIGIQCANLLESFNIADICPWVYDYLGIPCGLHGWGSAYIQIKYLQPIITQYFIDNKSEIWLLFLIAHSKR